MIGGSCSEAENGAGLGAAQTSTMPRVEIRGLIFLIAFDDNLHTSI